MRLKYALFAALLLQASLCLADTSTNDNDAAKKEISRLERKKSAEEANQLFQQKKYHEALVIYEMLLAQFPDEVDYLFAVGQIYTQLNNTKEAIKIYQKAQKSDPERYDIKTKLAYSYLKDKDYASAKELFEAIVKKQPDNIDAILGLGQTEAEQKHWNAAESHFQKAIKLAPNNTEALIHLADLRKVQNQTEAAKEIYETVLAKEPDNEKCQKGLDEIFEKNLLDKAKWLVKQQSYLEAIEIYQYLIEKTPKNVDYYFYLGNTYLKMEWFCNAIQAYTQGLNLKPENYEMRTALAYGYLRKGLWSPRLWPHYQWFWNYPYMFYFIKEDIYPRENRKDVKTSREIFAQVLDQKPAHADALAGYGKTEIVLYDKKDSAECYYQEALANEPENSTALSYYASLLASEGRYYSSRNLYLKLLAQDPNDFDTNMDYLDVVNASDPSSSLTAFYSQENEQDFITPEIRDWTVRLFDYGGVFTYSFAPCDRIKLFGLLVDEYIRLKNLLNKRNIYSLSIQRGGYGLSWAASPYVSVLGGCEFSYYSQYRHSTFHTKSNYYIQPYLNVTYQRNHHRAFIETTSDAPFVARDFTDNEAALVDRQFLRGLYEYDFGNRTLIGVTAANIWLINPIKSNQQQIATSWIQLTPPCYWQNIALRYQFIYGRFNHLTPAYYTYRFQTTHWCSLVLSKNWLNDRLITEAGYGHAWQRGFEQGQIIAVTPITAFHIVNREINAAFARVEFDPNDRVRFTVTATYTLDTFNYTTAAITGKLNWRF